MMIATTELYILLLACDLDLDTKSQQWEKAKTWVPFISQILEWIWIEFDVLLRLVGLVNFILVWVSYGSM